MNFARLPKWTLTSGVYFQLSRSALLVLGCLADALESNTDTGTIRTSRMVQKTGLSKQSVCDGVKELIGMGILERAKGQACFTLIDPSKVKHALPESSTLDHKGQAPLTPRSSTLYPEVKHALPLSTRNKEVPRTSYQEPSNQEEEPAASAADGIQFSRRFDSMIEQTGFPRPNPKDQREAIEAIARIESGMYPEALSVADPLEYLEPRLKYYWDEQVIRRANADKKLDEPALWRTLKEDRWRVDLDRPLPERIKSKDETIDPRRARMLERWAERAKQ